MLANVSLLSYTMIRDKCWQGSFYGYARLAKNILSDV